MWVKKINKYIVITLICYCIARSIYAGGLTLELSHTNLVDALRFIANSSKLDVIIGPNVMGSISLSVNNATPMQLLDSVIGSQQLVKWLIGKIWYIGTQEEFIKLKQQEIKLTE